MPTKAKTTEPPRWITLKQAGEQFQVHPITLRRWAASGLITLYQIGPNRSTRLDQHELDRVLIKKVPTE